MEPRTERRIAVLLSRYWRDAEVFYLSNGSTLYEIQHAGRPAVLKLFQPSPIEDGGYEAYSEVVYRFDRELRTASAFAESPYGLPVLDSGIRMQIPFMIFPKIEGCTLEDELVDGQMKPERALSILHKLTEAIEDLHGFGFLHRDLKPSNVLLAGESLFLIDFGCARSSRQSKPLDEPIYFSIGYTAPECFFPEEAEDESTDVFALAMIAGELLRGRTPYDVWCRRKLNSESNALSHYLDFLAHGPVPSLAADMSSLEPRLAQVFDRAASLARADRSTCREILAALPLHRVRRTRVQTSSAHAA